ncbi:MAG: alpha/beta hydrolase [Ilumatobacteraceae bacterium]
MQARRNATWSDTRRRARSAIGVALVAALAASAAACGPSPDVVTVDAEPIGPHDSAGPTGPTPDVGTVDWASCDGPVGPLVTFECGTITVPADYADPDGAMLDIALVRAPTADPDERIGSLVFNPGGPGGSGIEFLQSAALIVPAELSRRFDLVSFDPRGVGASTAIDCDVDFDDGVDLLEPGDDVAWDLMVEEALDTSARCDDDFELLASVVGTNNAARDLDEIRAALGDEQLSYVGFSYGTRLGATYAELFPDRVRALVLDGAVKPTTDAVALEGEQVAAFDVAFEAFADACDRDDDCALHDVGPAAEVFDGLVDELGTAGTLPTDDGDRVMTGGELQLAVLASMYSVQLWPILASALAQAEQFDDGSLLQSLADSYLGRQPDGTYDDSQAAGSAINCADDPARVTIDEVRADADLVADQTTWFPDLVRADTGCLGLPWPADPLRVGPAVGAPPILVIGNTRDPATPYQWAVELTDVLDSAVLFTVEADGHTAFLTIACVESTVVAYLIDLEVPEAGAWCANDAVADVFPAPGEGELDQLIGLLDCLRDNGADVPEFSVGDVLADPTGEVLLDLIDPTDPAFGDAIVQCGPLLAGP